MPLLNLIKFTYRELRIGLLIETLAIKGKNAATGNNKHVVFPAQNVSMNGSTSYPLWFMRYSRYKLILN